MHSADQASPVSILPVLFQRCMSHHVSFLQVTVLYTHGLTRTEVIAAVTFGDPTHVVDVAWDSGTSQHNGVGRSST